MGQISLKKNTNDVYLPALRDNRSRYLVLVGGAGSGKSWFAATKVIARAMQGRRRIVVIRKVGRTLRDSCWVEILDQLQLIRNERKESLLEYCRINRSELTITLPSGTDIMFRGFDDREKIKSIKGVTDFWIEEATEISLQDFRQIDLRLRGRADHPQIILSFNPIRTDHWLKKYFFDENRSSAHIIHSTYKDNKFLPGDYIRLLEALKDEDEYHHQVYTLGLWGTLGEVVFPKLVTKEISLEEAHYKRLIIGIDFGFVDPSVAVKIGEKEDGMYILDELYVTRHTNAEFMNRVKEQMGKDIQVIADSAEPDRIEEFRQHGFKIEGVSKTRGFKKYSIDFLRRRPIYIPPHCIHSRNELEAYTYKQTKDGLYVEEPVEFNDHVPDALIYASTGLNKTPKKAKAGKFPGYRR